MRILAACGLMSLLLCFAFGVSAQATAPAPLLATNTPAEPSLILATNTPQAEQPPVAVTLASAPQETTAYQQVTLYAGPGITFAEVGLLNAGIPATLVERNSLGTWVHLQRYDQGQIVMDGWAISGYLNLDAGQQFSQVPVNYALADGDPNGTDSQAMKRLLALPVIPPTISPQMAQVFARGLAVGNNAHVITKVGDSLVANEMYIEPLANPEIELGPYDYLADTVAFYGPWAGQLSVAARIGLTTQTILDPFWADPSLCQPNEDPLRCEFRLKKPAVALIMFGPNDVLHISPKRYSDQMRAVVEIALENGVIPVLFTFSYHPDNAAWAEALAFNLALADLADEYQVPLVNLWLAARIVPQYGLDVDLVHLKNSGFHYLKFTKGNDAFYGVTLQNLVALGILDSLRKNVFGG